MFYKNVIWENLLNEHNDGYRNDCSLDCYLVTVYNKYCKKNLLKINKDNLDVCNNCFTNINIINNFKNYGLDIMIVNLHSHSLNILHNILGVTDAS